MRIIWTGRFEMHIVRIASFEDIICNPRVWLERARHMAALFFVCRRPVGVNCRCAIMMAY